METAAFFFGYCGLGMAIIEYELRYYLINGIYVENPPETYIIAPPEGVNESRERMLVVLLSMNLLSTFCTCVVIFTRYWLTLKWKI